MSSINKAISNEELLPEICQAIAEYLALGNETIEANGARFVRNGATPRRFDANHIGMIRTDDPVVLQRILAEAETLFAASPHRCVIIDALTPPGVEAQLLLDGTLSLWGTVLHMVLRNELEVTPKQHDIREIHHESDWDAYRELRRLDSLGDAEQHGRPLQVDEPMIAERVAYVRAKVPDVRFWLAYIDEQPVAYLNSWPGTNGIGQVEDLFTHPAYRHRGVATALIAHAVLDARDRGAGVVAITADPADTPKDMYAAMGFEPVCVSRRYVRL